MKIAVITPVSHLPDILPLLKEKGHKLFLHEESSKSEVREALLGNKIDAIICNPNQQTYLIDRALLKDTGVTLINTCSTGTNHIDLEYCRSAGIKVQSLKMDTDLLNELPSTAELSFGLMLSLLRKIPQGSKDVEEFKWDYIPHLGRQVKDLKIGIVGYGRLGKMMSGYCDAFGADTYICDPYSSEPSISLVEMFETCDVISLHVHVTPDTKYMINEDLLKHIRGECYIINTSRGEIVNEKDIVDSLSRGVLTGYGTDVVEDEFDDLTKSPIIKAMKAGKNVIVTPHVGGMTIEGQTKAYKWSIKKL